jgi:hypothetical protein
MTDAEVRPLDLVEITHTRRTRKHSLGLPCTPTCQHPSYPSAAVTQPIRACSGQYSTNVSQAVRVCSHTSTCSVYSSISLRPDSGFRVPATQLAVRTWVAPQRDSGRHMCGASTPAQTSGATICQVLEPMTEPKSPMKSQMESAVRVVARSTWESMNLVEVA